MIPNLQEVTIFVRPGITDMRKQVNGLSIIVDEHMNKDPGSGNLFLFCNRERKLLKCLWWDRSGFVLWQKRLERGKFPWPSTNEEARLISENELTMILSGIDFWNAHQEMKYQQMN